VSEKNETVFLSVFQVLTTKIKDNISELNLWLKYLIELGQLAQLS